MKLIFFTIIVCILGYSANSQDLDTLINLSKEIQKNNNDSIRSEANRTFTTELEKILLKKESFTRNFDSLKSVSVQTSPDDKFRIFTWTMPAADKSSYRFFGFIQVKTDTVNLIIRLNDSTSVIKKPESEKLIPDRWLGAVYYRIIPVKTSGKTYYTLLGWKGKDQKYSQKIIEVLHFDRNKAKFGYSLFKIGTVYKSRIIFTHDSQVSMTVRYDENENGIVYDHLTEIKNGVMGPDGTYDILKFRKGKWMLERDIDAKTDWEPKQEFPVPPVDEK